MAAAGGAQRRGSARPRAETSRIRGTRGNQGGICDFKNLEGVKEVKKISKMRREGRHFFLEVCFLVPGKDWGLRFGIWGWARVETGFALGMG